MKTTVKKAVVKWLFVLVGILVIASALQFLVYLRGVDLLVLSVESMPGPTDDEETERYFLHKLGWNKAFVPDLWPFDNTSIWR